MIPEIAAEHIALLSQFSYLGIFIAVAMAGHFVPVPEDISLVAAGYLVAIGFASMAPMLVVGMTAPLFADGLLFYLAKTGSRFAPDPEKYAGGKVFRYFSDHMRHKTFRTVFIMRFVTGLRFMSPILAAYIKVPYKKYLAANAVSAAAFGPAFILLGFHLSERITALISLMRSLEKGILIALGSALLILMLHHALRRYNAYNAEE